MGFIERLILLFAGHALCDYPLQGDFLAKGKNPRPNMAGTGCQHSAQFGREDDELRP